jgi:hypothetical protein
VNRFGCAKSEEVPIDLKVSSILLQVFGHPYLKLSPETTPLRITILWIEY